jgi:glucosamine-6-phosphate deaminase
MGHEIANEIRKTREQGIELALILPAGPMGMYEWAVYFLKEWRINCDHVYGFNMDEWCDSQGNTLSSDNPGSFEYAMTKAFYGPLGEYTIPENQRNFATKDNLPQYAEKISDIRSRGGRLVTAYGIGRAFHIAFWEPHFASEYADFNEWSQETHRIAANLHPLTIEQNALTSFKSRSTKVPCRANTVGPGLFLQSDYMIGGCDGVFGRGMNWQAMSLCVTLKYGPNIWITSSYVPTKPGKLFYLEELINKMDPEVN